MSTLRTNAREGMDAKNSITIVAGTGNITTTNVQEGLAKCWIQLNGDSFAVNDSNNVTSATDNGTGDYTVTIANDMSNALYAVNNFIAGGDDRRSAHSARDEVATGSFNILARSSNPSDSNALVDEQKCIGTVHGDLA